MPGAAAVPRNGKETVLLVEDEAVILDFVKAMLQSMGYTVGNRI